MLIVRVELHSAITGQVTEIARMEIVNDGTGTEYTGNYNVRTLRGRNHGSFLQRITQNEGRIKGWKRKEKHVWRLVSCALHRCKYGYAPRGRHSEKAGE